MTTAQELFDKVATHLLKQYKVSDDDEGCLYRGPGGLKCAVGCLIPDDAYSVDMESLRVSDLVNGNLLRQDLRLVFIEHLDLLDDLQQIHDVHQEPSVWEKALRLVAKKYKLEWHAP